MGCSTLALTPYCTPQAFAVGVGLVLISSIGLQLVIVRHLRVLALPEAYIARFRIQSILIQIGNVAALSMLVYGVVAQRS